MIAFSASPIWTPATLLIGILLLFLTPFCEEIRVIDTQRNGHSVVMYVSFYVIEQMPVLRDSDTYRFQHYEALLLNVH